MPQYCTSVVVVVMVGNLVILFLQISCWLKTRKMSKSCPNGTEEESLNAIPPFFCRAENLRYMHNRNIFEPKHTMFPMIVRWYTNRALFLDSRNPPSTYYRWSRLCKC